MERRAAADPEKAGEADGVPMIRLVQMTNARREMVQAAERRASRAGSACCPT